MQYPSSCRRVLITGGAGFLGSHLTDRLLASGYCVRILDNLDPQVHPAGVPAYLHPQADLHVASVTDPVAVDRALDGVDAVVHFAAIVGVGQSMYQIARYSEVNFHGTAVLLDGMLRRQPRCPFTRLLVAGSMSLYGEGRYHCPACHAPRDTSPRPRAQLLRQAWELACTDCGATLLPRPTDEAKPPQLASFYAQTKYMQEQMCLLFGRTYAVPTLALRFFNTYGPRQSLANPYTGVAAVFAAELLAGRAPQVFEDGAQLRDFVNVHDVARACQLALESDTLSAHDSVFNIASGVSLTIAQLAQRMAHALDLPIEPSITGRFRLGDARHCIANIDAARGRLGFAPQISLDQGMRELSTWLRTQSPVPACAHVPSQAHATAELAAYGLTG